MTTMRSAISTASSTSCVMSTQEMPRSLTIERNQPRMSRLVRASRALNGSSMSTTSLSMR